MSNLNSRKLSQVFHSGALFALTQVVVSATHSTNHDEAGVQVHLDFYSMIRHYWQIAFCAPRPSFDFRPTGEPFSNVTGKSNTMPLKRRQIGKKVNQDEPNRKIFTIIINFKIK